MKLRVPILAVVAASAAAAPAQAAVLAEQVGSRAAFAVGSDPAQTVHAVWLPPNLTEATARLIYCQGATDSGRASTKDLKVSEPDPMRDGYDPPQVFTFQQAPGLVVVASNAGAPKTITLWISTNNGDSFGEPRQIGFGEFYQDGVVGWLGGLSRLYAIGGSQRTFTEGKGWLINSYPFNGDPLTSGPGFVADTGRLASASIGLAGQSDGTADQRPVALFDNNGETFFSLGVPPASATRAYGAASDWSASRRLIGGGAARLAEAPASTSWALPARAILFDDLERPVVVGIDEGGLAGQPFPLGQYSTRSDDPQHGIALGGDDRIHVAWVAKDEFGPDSLLYAYSQKGGAPPYSTPVELATAVTGVPDEDADEGDDSQPDQAIRNILLVINDSRGGIAWNKGGALIYEPLASPDSAAAGLRARASQSGGGASAGRAQVKRNAALTKGTFATVLAKRGCVAKGSKYRVRALVGNKVKFARKRFKVRRAKFGIDRRRQAVDRRGPFSARFGTAGLRSGRHKLTLRFERKRGGARKLIYRFAVC